MCIVNRATSGLHNNEICAMVKSLYENPLTPEKWVIKDGCIFGEGFLQTGNFCAKIHVAETQPLGGSHQLVFLKFNFVLEFVVTEHRSSAVGY